MITLNVINSSSPSKNIWELADFLYILIVWKLFKYIPASSIFVPRNLQRPDIEVVVPDGSHPGSHTLSLSGGGLGFRDLLGENVEGVARNIQSGSAVGSSWLGNSRRYIR